MADKAEQARQLFLSGANCAQAVLGAFHRECGLDFDAAMRLASGFGGGMGRLREVCGAFSGSCMVAGLLRGYDNENGVDKGSHYALIQRLALKNKLQNGSIICKELLGATVNLSSADPSVRTAEYVKKRPCAELCRIAADILAEELGID